jgi:hypothetical protein
VVSRAGVVCFVVVVLALLASPAAEAAGPPQIGPNWTSGVGTTAATLNAEIDPDGLATTYHFSYLSEAAYQANLSQGQEGFSGAAGAPSGADPDIGSGTTFVTVAQSIGSLSFDTTYRYRVQASNSAGTEVGAARLFTTEAFGGGPVLLDDRAWEMVSPLDKGGGQVQGPGGSFGGGTIQAAAGGSALTFSSLSSFGADAQGAPAASQYVARRGAGGWATQNITPATVAGAYGDEPDGVPHQLFSPDLARALMLDGLCAAGDPCPRRYSLRETASGAFTTSPEEPDLRFAGATADLGQVVLSTCAALTADAIAVPLGGGCDPAQANLYRWSAGGLSLINLLPAAAQGTPGAALAAQAGAVSADGTRVYWTLASNLYLREGATTKQIDATVGGGGTFETASLTGSVAFFSKAGHLYRYEAASSTATDLTPGGGLQGVLDASADGAYVYYLTSGGLFLRHGATPTEVADAADAGNYPPATGTARVSPDGTHLAFLSSASLTGYDNRRQEAGAAPPGPPQTEIFLYDAGTATLTCASCNPTGERPLGPSTIPGARPNGKGSTATRAYKPRVLSDDGHRLFFDSADSLALADTAKRPDVYEWEAQGAGTCQRAGGCVSLISRGRNSEGAGFLDASASGADVFFLTADSLVGADSGFADVYDAREGGGFPEPEKPIECLGDACQFLPSEPEDPQPGTLVPSVGNPPLRIAGPAKRCKKGYVKKRGRCVKKPRRHKKNARRTHRRPRDGRS